jgi:hypothetical protein
MQETLRGGGLDSFLKKSFTYFLNCKFDHVCETLKLFRFSFLYDNNRRKQKEKHKQNKEVVRRIS